MIFPKEDSAKSNQLPEPGIPSSVSTGAPTSTPLNFIDPLTGRHLLDTLYEQFAKPTLSRVLKPNEPSIYIRHKEGQEVAGGYKVEKVFEDAATGFYAEGRVPLFGTNPPVLVIRGYGSWYPFERVIEDTPDVFIAGLERHFKSAQTQGAVDWLKQQFENGKQADITGESLGGKVAQQLAARYEGIIRSTVTFNSLGVSRKLARTSKAKNVFHYFTLGEKYAFWANRGDYIPGHIFQISKKGKNCQYKIEEAIIRLVKFNNFALFYSKFRKRKFFLIALVQLILLKRHNELILNRLSPVIVQIELNQLRKG